MTAAEHDTTTDRTASPADDRRRTLALPGIVLGIGLGGFVDGILLHQILQWHHMLTGTDDDRLGVDYYSAGTVHGLEINTVWDGLFHTFTWLAVLIGLALLYSRVTDARRRLWTSRALWGWVLVGWGVFNLVEGVIDHHILRIHHVRSGEHQLLWDLGFLLFGALLLVGGWALQRTARPIQPRQIDATHADR
ncbi:MAG: DUF2243 domain-containing protein [Actinomycetota bacterium]|nr:DUF2243 domain-containing protein [Actinomycetota bacterium]